jgi:hypothetical protein
MKDQEISGVEISGVEISGVEISGVGNQRGQSN